MTALNGIIKDLPIDEYHASEGLSASAIKLLLECPKKYWYEYLNPSKHLHDSKESRCLVIGQALHTKVLEPYAFNNRFYTWPAHLEKIDRRTKKGKEEFNNILNINQGKTYLNANEMEQVQSMVDAVFSNRDYNNIMSHKENTHIETSLYFKHKNYDVLLKSRPDLFNDFMVLDLKTTLNASEEDFKKSIYKYGYHIQAALALDALEHICPQATKREFVILAVEKLPPYLTAVYVLDNESIEIGREKYKQGIGIYKECLRNKRWNGYPEGIRSIGLPAWAINQSMNATAEMISAPF
jgi:exodeoxyribonuclease VIII